MQSLPNLPLVGSLSGSLGRSRSSDAGRQYHPAPDQTAVGSYQCRWMIERWGRLPDKPRTTLAFLGICNASALLVGLFEYFFEYVLNIAFGPGPINRVT